MRFYTWKDIERCLLLNQKKWINTIIDFEVYSSEIIIYLSSISKLKEAQNILSEILENKYDFNEGKIYLELGNRILNVIYEEGEESENTKQITPLFNKILYQESAYYSEMLTKSLPGSPVIAFHSYKGGVGRTLSLLAFAKSWSSVSTNKKLLIVDSDIEAPGITWLSGEMDEDGLSYLDLLEVIQGKTDVDDIVNTIVDKIGSLIISISTDLMAVEHIVIPTYRYIEQLLDMYSSPESIASSYNKKYVIAEVLSKLGEKIGAGAVLVDLRAGISEFSAPILFDPRVKKYLVTSTSYQSIKGTELLLQQLSKGLPLNENIMLPEILLTMVPDGFNTADIISKLIAIYDKSEVDMDGSFTDNLVTELPFASELVHLESLKQIMRNLEGRDFYKNIYSLVKDNYSMEEKKTNYSINYKREEIIQKIHELSKKQINAEGNTDFNVLMTQPINNLVKKYSNNIPTTIIMGAKGSGKTFLYREIMRKLCWEKFLIQFDKSNLISENINCSTIVVPLLAATNSSNFKEILQKSIENFNKELEYGKMSMSFWLDNRDNVKKFLRETHDTLEWGEFWKGLLLGAFGKESTLEKVEEQLEINNRKVVFLIDGLEEILTQTLKSETEKNAVIALCQDFLNELKIKYKNIGCVVFLRKDLARNSIEVNFEQFNTLYKSVELNWSRTEALRLVLWLVNQAIPDFYQEKISIEVASSDIIEHNLVNLWGVKLGKATSNEAYASRWILAALSDFNGQLQARDIIRFLQYATEEEGRNVYEDRYIMPAEIKKAVPKCSSDKINEVKQEIDALKPIFEKLDKAPSEKKVLPFYSEMFDLNATEEKLMKQEGYLKIDNDKYYLPEIIRHALKFKYEKGARPKVLSLLFGK